MFDEMTQNPWNIVQSLYELQYFNCLSCSYRNKSKQDFIIHAYDFHPEATNILKNIHDGSTSDITLPWDRSEEIKYEDTKYDDNTDYNYDDIEDTTILMIDINEEIQNKENVVCKNCGKTCTSIASLNVHLFVCKKPENTNEQEVSQDIYPNSVSTFSVKLETKNEINDESEIKIEENVQTITKVEEKLKNHTPIIHYSCDKCQKMYPSKDLLRRHVIKYHSEKTYKCDKCEKEFVTEKGLSTHETIKHEESCHQCDKSFTTKGRLKNHISIVHEGLKRISCDQCKKKLISKVDLSRHVKRFHSEKTYKCDMCEEKFVTKMGLNRHKAIKHEEIGVKNKCCHICRKQLKSRTAYNHHIIRHQVPEHKCDKCEKSYHFLRQLQQHVNIKHEDTSKVGVICQYCGKQYKSQNAYNYHINTHQVQKYKCDKCDKSYHLLSKLQEHEKYIHEGIKAYQCEKCGNDFGTKHLLYLHQRRGKCSTIRRFKCEKCEKKFKAKEHLQRHIATFHEGRKDYPCSECGKFFTTPVVVKTHIDIVHKGIKKYKCDICKAAFGFSHDMKRHRASVHFGEKLRK